MAEIKKRRGSLTEKIITKAESQDLTQAITMRYSKKDSVKHYKKVTVAEKNGFKTGRWSRTEHLRFVQAIKMYGEHNYEALKHHIGSRSGKQIRSHQQKYFNKVSDVMGGMPTGKELAQIEGIGAKSDRDDDDLMSDSGAQVVEYQRHGLPKL